MASTLRLLFSGMGILRQHLRNLNDVRREYPDAGYSAEAVLVIALLVSLALGAVGLIVSGVMAKAASIDFG